MDVEEERMDTELPETGGYKPRPKWQLLLAWLALGAFILVLVFYYLSLFRGGA